MHLDDGVGDAEYLRLLNDALARAGAVFQPDLVCYLAGADPYREDQLGGLNLSVEGLRRRDDCVYAAASVRGVPIMVTLAGGYAAVVRDTVTIHVNTILALAEARPATAGRGPATSASPGTEELHYG